MSTSTSPRCVSDLQREWTPSELIAVAEAAGRVGEPGGPHHYSNTNYIVLGEIIEQVTGNSWADEVRTRIAEPLGMTHTEQASPTSDPWLQASSTARSSMPRPSPTRRSGAPAARCSRRAAICCCSPPLADGTLLSPDSQAAMQAFVPGEDLSQFGIVHGYGLGLEHYATDAITVIGHMGTGEAHSAFLGYDAEHGTAVAVMTNTAVAGPQAIIAIEALTAVSQAG